MYCKIIIDIYIIYIYNILYILYIFKYIILNYTQTMRQILIYVMNLKNVIINSSS